MLQTKHNDALSLSGYANLDTKLQSKDEGVL